MPAPDLQLQDLWEVGHLGVHLYFYQTFKMDSYVYTEFYKPFPQPSDFKSWLLPGITWGIKRGIKKKEKQMFG